MKGIKIQSTQTVMAVASHYKAQKDRALSDLELYLNRPTAVGGHSDVFDDLINIFEKLEKYSNMLDMVESMIEKPQSPQSPKSEQSETLSEIINKPTQGIGSSGDFPEENKSDK